MYVHVWVLDLPDGLSDGSGAGSGVEISPPHGPRTFRQVAEQTCFPEANTFSFCYYVQSIISSFIRVKTESSKTPASGWRGTEVDSVGLVPTWRGQAKCRAGRRMKSPSSKLF